ncbi:uncharacterized protein LOC125944569 [Dermacentor silvarum]|uniref:uncharacterized protein LOC125944569 n=1 Tax=Dermacentor silvarum TaxID=543639 RepID=UPI00210089C1|nr:uncharacterized protein LOC125944569 [Dermacentor silvarum]
MSDTRNGSDGSVPATSSAATVSNESGTLQPCRDLPQLSDVMFETTTGNSTLPKVSDADIGFEYLDEMLKEDLDDRLRSFHRPSATKEERLSDFYRIRRLKMIMAM